jgi:hypothetical protein
MPLISSFLNLFSGKGNKNNGKKDKLHNESGGEQKKKASATLSVSETKVMSETLLYNLSDHKQKTNEAEIADFNGSKQKINVLTADEESLLQGGIVDLKSAESSIKDAQSETSSKEEDTVSTVIKGYPLDSGFVSIRRETQVAIEESPKGEGGFAVGSKAMLRTTLSMKTVATTIRSDAFGLDENVSEFRWANTPAFTVPTELNTQLSQ